MLTQNNNKAGEFTIASIRLGHIVWSLEIRFPNQKNCFNSLSIILRALFFLWDKKFASKY